MEIEEIKRELDDLSIRYFEDRPEDEDEKKIIKKSVGIIEDVAYELKISDDSSLVESNNKLNELFKKGFVGIKNSQMLGFGEELKKINPLPLALMAIALYLGQEKFAEQLLDHEKLKMILDLIIKKIDLNSILKNKK